ncbi:hypothetical protein [Amycolatopsis orientalis]|uniref:hypothetical protein n=1 Tax=Amycolatopsis orientalis TaxID=31958 RepID=UPI001319DDBF|nr:hypothetical protein [Amycolatopsis orientalis]
MRDHNGWSLRERPHQLQARSRRRGLRVRRALNVDAQPTSSRLRHQKIAENAAQLGAFHAGQWFPGHGHLAEHE